MSRFRGVFLALAGVLPALAPARGGPPEAPSAASARPPIARKEIVLRAWGVPSVPGVSVGDLSTLKVLQAFGKEYPYIRPISSGGLEIPGRTMDYVPLMQIAGDIPPHVMYVNFRQSETYISNKLLYPLDRYIEKETLGQDLPDGPLLSQSEYVARLKKSPRYKAEIEDRFPERCWEVIRRECPYGEECAHCRQWGVAPRKVHYHVWAFPHSPCVMALLYRRDLFHEAGLPDRAPATMEEFLQFARALTNPKDDAYGLDIGTSGFSWSTLSFLYSCGGLLVDQDANGQWRCAFDSEGAVEAYHFVARLLLEPFDNRHGHFDSVIFTGQTQGGATSTTSGEVKIGMTFAYLDTKFFTDRDPAKYGLAPVPRGPTGFRGSEFNSTMTGIYAGLEDDEETRDAAWAYIRFFNGSEARRIRTTVFVENGMGRFVQPRLLVEANFPEYVEQVPKEWRLAYEEALQNGIPEPYGRNCQMVYYYASQSIDQIRTDGEVKDAVRKKDAERAKARIRQILKEGVVRSNEKMLGILTPGQKRTRSLVASVAAVAILIVFAWVFRRVFKTFRAASAGFVDPRRRGWQFGRYKWAYILLAPAIGSIALWAYYPLARGTLISFENYNVRGFSQWVGLENFANVLFDAAFWHAVWVSLKYAALFALFGFTAPIALAFLLTEVPSGKIFYRTVYYLPAVLSGVIVMFLWKGFYGQYGMINMVLNGFLEGLAAVVNFFLSITNHLLVAWNWLVGLVHLSWGAGAIGLVQFAEVHTAWLDQPGMALFFVLLPVIWAGMGPGCLIYLAALKTVPEEIYESADIDGAGLLQKVRHVSLPSIRALVLINFIGAIIGAVRGGSEYVLAMTGGGPYAPYGATEVVGLHIYWQAYGYLRFGAASAMAWVLGSMLVGFTVLRLQQLSRMEFKTASGVGQ